MTKRKKDYIDDGHTVYSMDGLDELRRGTDSKKNVGLTRKERWAAIKAALAVYLPIFVGVLACFGIAALLLYFWLT